MAHLIQLDSPASSHNTTSEPMEVANPSIPSNGPTTRRNKTLLTPTALQAIDSLNTSTPVTDGSKELAHTILRTLRTDGTRTGHPPSIQKYPSLTIADNTTIWSTYIIIFGFTHTNNSQDDLKELTSILNIWTTTAIPDSAWFATRYIDNAHAIVRNATKEPAGHIFKLANCTLFGTIGSTTPLLGSISSAAYIINSENRKGASYQTFALPDPIDLRYIQLPSIYPTLLTIRGLPVNRDLGALTAATIFLVQHWFQTHFPNKAYIVPTFYKHSVVKEGRKPDGMARDLYSHPQLNQHTRTLKRTNLSELILDVIYIGAHDTPESTYDSTRTALLDRLRQSPDNSQGLYPYLQSFSGIMLECLLSYDDCTKFLRRHPTIVSQHYPRGFFITGFPDAILATDFLDILAANENNRDNFPEFTQVLVGPPVHYANPPVGTRVIILTDHVPQWLDLDRLHRYYADHDPPCHFEFRSHKLHGFERQYQLIELYETYYAQHDVFLANTTTNINPAHPHTHAPTTQPPSTTSIQSSQATARVSNFATRSTISQHVYKGPASLPQTNALATVPSSTASTHSTQITRNDNNKIMHMGRTLDIADFIQQVVIEQLQPLQQELRAHVANQNSLQRDLIANQVLNQEQAFIRHRTDYKKNKRELDILRRERTHQQNPAIAHDLDQYIQQDQAALDEQIIHLQRLYTDTLRAAHDQQVPLITLTGNESQDF